MSKIHRDPLLTYLWVPRVFNAALEHGLPWHRLCAMAVILSGGENTKRELDHNYLHTRLSQDNPCYAPMYTDTGEPTVELIDRATKWGLFQIHGEQARSLGFKGRLTNLSNDWDTNIKLACKVLEGYIQKTGAEDFREAEKFFGIDSALVDDVWREMETEITELMKIPVGPDEE